MKNQKLLDLADWLISIGKKNGVDEVSIVIAKSKQSSFEVRKGEIDLLEGAEESSLALSLYIDSKFSVNRTSVFEKEALENFLETSVNLTKQLNKDEYRALPNASLYWKDKPFDIEIEDKKYINITPETKKNIAIDLERKTSKISKNIVSVTSSYSDSFSEMIKVNSNGFVGEKISTTFSVGSEVVVKGEGSALPSDWFYSYTRMFEDTPDLDIIAKNSVRMAEAKVGQKKIASGNYSMIVSNRVASKLIGMILSSITGSKLWNKNTFLDGKLDKKIFSDKLTIIDEPYIKRGLGSKLFDGDGFKTKKRAIIEDGVLQYYLLNNYFAKKLNLSPTTGSTSNICLKLGESNILDMIKGLNRGILVNGFLGGNFNSTSGDFSFGINGNLIENGNLTKPVNEMNITGNVVELFNNLLDVGNDPYLYSSYRIPSLFFDNVSFNGL